MGFKNEALIFFNYYYFYTTGIPPKKYWIKHFSLYYQNRDWEENGTRFEVNP